MEIIDQILERCELGSKKIDELSQRVKVSAINCGKSQLNKPLSSEDWSLVDIITDGLWYEDYELDEQINAGFNLFELFPSYWPTLTPYYDHLREKKLNSQLKEKIWTRFVHYLGDEAYYADPVGYVLWVDFFEDSDTVQETWNGLISHNKDKKSLRKLIESAGPVSFDLKEPIYWAMMKDQKNHQAIFNSLLFSAYDLYGQIEKRKAGHILSKLKVDKGTKEYKLLTDKIR